MPRRDVDLVIRARDEAKATLEAITTALKDFSTGQEGAQRVSAETDNVLTRLGASFTELQRRIGGQGVTGRLEADVRAARTAYETLFASVAETRVEIDRYGREAREAAQETMRLRMEAAALAGSIERQESAVAQARAAQRSLAQETGRSARAQEQYVTSQRRLQSELDRVSGRLAQQRERYRSLQAQIITTSQPTRTLIRSFNSASAAIQKTELRIADLTETQRLVAAESDRAARSAQRAGDVFGRQARSVGRLETELGQLREQYAGVNRAVAASTQHQSRLEASLRKSSEALERQGGQLERADRAYTDIQRAALGTLGALEQLETTARGPLLRAFGEQRNRLKQTEESFRANSAEAQRLARQLRATAAPSRELSAAFNAYRTAAAAGRQEIRNQQILLSRLREVLRETGGDLDQFASRQNRVANLLKQAATSFANYDRSSRSAVQSNQRLADSQRRTAEESRRVRVETDRLAASQRRAAVEANTLSGAIRRFFGGSRQALSFFQRLRSEILALTAAYGGLFAAIQGIQNVLQAGITLQGIANRLRVVFSGDEGRVAQELDFLRRTADRLGIEFGRLANEYSKFSIATQGTVLAGQQTRKIFLAVAEAARVQNLSIDQIEGTFLALTQIVSKGVVSMEELRRQLGDRLPGAVQIMAAALNITTAELIKLVENGDLSSDVLSQFADELTRRFGPQLGRALFNVSAALGRFQNQLFLTYVRIGNAGAVQGLTDLFNRLSQVLADPQFQSFADRIGAGIGALARGVAVLAENFDALTIVIVALIARRIAPVIAAVVAQFRAWVVAVAAARVQTAGLAATAGTTTTALGTATTAVRGFTFALRGLLASTGIGLAVTAIGAAIATWVTSTDDATAALTTHQNVLDRVKNAYEAAAGSAEKFRDAIAGASVAEAIENLENQQTALEQAEMRLRQSVDTRPLEALGPAVRPDTRLFLDLLTQARDEYEQGTLSLEELSRVIDQIVITFQTKFVPGVAETGTSVLQAAREVDRLRQSVEEAAIAVTALQGDFDAAGDIAGDLEDAGDAAADQAAKLREFQEALREFAMQIPSLREEIERIETLESFDAQRENLIQLAREAGVATDEVERLYRELLNIDRAAEIFDGATDGLLAAANLLRSVTDLSGEDLARTVLDVQEQLRQQLGDAAFDTLSGRQQAVLTEIAHTLGGLPDELATAIRTAISEGVSDQAADAIRGLQGLGRDPSLLATVFGEDDIDASGFIRREERVRERERRLREAERRLAEREAERERRQREQAIAATQEQVRELGFRILQQERLNAGLEREAAIESALRQARQRNPEILQEELSTIRQRAGLLFDLQNLGREEREQRERALEAERRVNDLLRLRSALEQELAALRELGIADERVAALPAAIARLGEEIRIAANEAIRLLEPFAELDPAIQAAISRLRVLNLEAANTGRLVRLSAESLARAFAGSASGALTTFVETLRETRSVAEALKLSFRRLASDFLRRVADMIIQQLALNAALAAFNALSGGGGGGFGRIIGSIFGFQSGGGVGPGGRPVRLPSSGRSGLGRDGFLSVLHEGEEVIPAGHPRNAFTGAGAGVDGGTTIINAIDSVSFLEEAYSQQAGRRVTLNFMASNRSAMRRALGIT